MEAAFWTGFFGAVVAVVTAVAVHLKNQQQDAMTEVIARRMSILEAELVTCHEDRRRLEVIIVDLLHKLAETHVGIKPSISSGESDSAAIKKPR